MKNSGIIIGALLVIVIGVVAWVALKKPAITTTAGKTATTPQTNTATGQNPFTVLQNLLAQGQTQAPTDQFSVDQASSNDAISLDETAGGGYNAQAAGNAQADIAFALTQP